MARTRNIKPGFFKNDLLAECSPLARILFAGLWTIADRDGRGEYRPKLIKAEVLPYDDCNVNALMGELVDREFVHVYEDGDRLLFEIPTFGTHQNPHKDEKSREYRASTVQVRCKYDSSREKTGSGRAFYLVPSTFHLAPSTSLMGAIADGDAPTVPEPEQPPESPIVFEFECDGKPKHFYVRQSLIEEFAGFYPSLDVTGEIRSALAWVKAKPSNRKTHGGMRAFLTSWLNRSQNRNRSGPAPPASRFGRARTPIPDDAFPRDEL